MELGLRIIPNAIAFRLFFTATSILITIAISRYLGLEAFGRYAWLTSIAFLLSGLSQAGGNNLVVRETSRSSGREAPIRVLLRTAVASLLTLAALIGVALFFTTERMTPATLVPVVLLAVGNLALVLLCAATRGIGRVQAGQIPELVLRPGLFLFLIGTVALWGADFGPEAMVYMQVLAYAIVAVAAAALLARGLADRPNEPMERLDTGWLSGFFRLGIIGWLTIGNTQLLVILTGTLANYAEVGLYRVATQAALVVGLGLTAIETVQAPAYARTYKDKNRRDLHDLLQKSCRIGVLISGVILLVLLIFGRPLLVLFFGTSFAAAYPSLCVLAAAQMINSVTGNVGVMMIAAKHEKKLIGGTVAALMCTIIAAWLFIPKYGALAAAIASGLGLTVRNFMATWFCWRAFGILALPYAPYAPGATNRESP
jgi:O-antigen/teichoic acid export membrane protein